jgi:hypothetical protein
MRQEKCEFDKAELQSLLESAEPADSNLPEFEKKLGQTIERRRLLDILIHDINTIEYTNRK